MLTPDWDLQTKVDVLGPDLTPALRSQYTNYALYDRFIDPKILACTIIGGSGVAPLFRELRHLLL
jgi:hypothetical protein